MADRTERKLLTFDEIVSRPLREREVEVPQWGGYVRIREITKAEQQSIRAQARRVGPNGEDVDVETFERLLLAAVLAEPRITAEQAAQLMQQSAAAVDTILLAALELNGMTEEAQARLRRSFPARAT